jgi:NitT/TauT family transport system substrate-binding protein
MKKLILSLLIVTLLLSAALFAACNNGEETEFRFALPDGTPVLSVAKLVNDGAIINGEKIKIEVVNPTNIGSEVAGERADLAILPTNAAANLIKQGAPYKIVASNIFGVLYIIGKSQGQITPLDLVGKVVASIGQGNTPQFVLEAILDDAGIDYQTGTAAVAEKVVINYVADGTAVQALMQAEQADYGLLGEPAVTASFAKGYYEVYDLQEGYRVAMGKEETGYPQASLVVKNSLIESRPDFVEALLVALEENVDWIMDTDNQAGLTDLLATAGSASKYPPASVPRSYVDLKRAAVVKDDVKLFLSECFGITLTDEAFYLPE